MPGGISAPARSDTDKFVLATDFCRDEVPFRFRREELPINAAWDMKEAIDRASSEFNLECMKIRTIADARDVARLDPNAFDSRCHLGRLP